MSLEQKNGETVHYPKRRDVFRFDNEVAAVFDSMAPRSIPMYNEVHRMHLSMLRHRLIPGAVVMDIGSSTGHLFRNIERQLGAKLAETGIRAFAIDSSHHMMDRLLDEFPTVATKVGDLGMELPVYLPFIDPPADLMICLYTLQFVPPPCKKDALEWLVRNTKVGGYLVLGQKETIEGAEVASLFGEEYYKFRRDNGYSQEEIDAKTEALKGSMFTVPHRTLLDSLASLGVEAIETSRWLEFSTVLGVRRR